MPRGAVRFEVRPLFGAFDSRFPSSEGLGRTLGDDFSAPGIGPNLVPALETFEGAVESAAGTNFSVRIGSLKAILQKSQIRVPLSLDVGIFDWLSVGVTMPLVRDEAEMAAGFLPSGEANAGFSPGVGDPQRVEDFLGSFSDALTSLGTIRGAACSADPVGQSCSDATALSSDATAFLSAMTTLYQSSYLTPLEASVAGEAILARWTGFQQSFGAFGVEGLPAALPLAQEPLDAADFDRFLSDPRFGTALSAPLRRWENLWRLGDIEFRTDARILGLEWSDAGVDDSTAAAPRARLDVGGGLTLRLGTGSEDDPANILDQAAGDGQSDVEIRGWAIGSLGQHLGLWSEASFTRPFQGSTIRRVYDPAVVFAPRNTQLPLSWTQGSAITVRVAPVFKISSELSGLASYTYHRKNEDRFQYPSTLEASEGETLPDPSILRRGSDAQIQTLSLGLVYRTVGNTRGAAPIEIRALYHRAVRGTGGDVPRLRSIEAGFRVFKGLWGRPD